MTTEQNRRDVIRVKPGTEGAEPQQLADGRTVHVLRRTDLIAREREKRRTWQHGHIGIHWFVAGDGITHAAHDTDQPTAPRSMHVRTVEGQIVVSIGSYSRIELENIDPTVIDEAKAEAAGLQARGYRVGETKSRAWYEAACAAHTQRKHAVSPTVESIVQARLLYGIPLDSAVRHAMRKQNLIGTSREKNLRRQAQRRIARLRTWPEA